MCITCICKVVYIFINTVIYHFIYHSKNITYLFGIQYFICIFVVQKRTQKVVLWSVFLSFFPV